MYQPVIIIQLRLYEEIATIERLFIGPGDADKLSNVITFTITMKSAQETLKAAIPG